jgi:hypothetical protein
VTSISNGLFNYCANLTSVVIPSSVTSIRFAPFAECTGLTSITYEGTMAQWNAITKDFYWNRNAYFTEVICSDGVVSLD